MDGRTRRIVMLALGSVAVAGCSGGGDGADLDEWCDLNEQFWSEAGSVTTADGDQLEELFAEQGVVLDDAVDVAPDDIAGDAEDLSSAWGDIGDLLADADFDWSAVDADELSAFEREISSEVDTIQQFNEAECGLDPIAVGLLPADDGSEPTDSETTDSTDSTEPGDDAEATDDSGPPFTLPDITIDGTFPTDDSGAEPGTAIIDLLTEMFQEQIGLPEDKARRLAEQVDIDDFRADEQPDMSDAFEWFEACDITLADLDSINPDDGDAPSDDTTGVPDLGDVTIPADVDDIDEMIVDIFVESLGIDEEQARCLVDNLDITSTDVPDMSEMVDLFEECNIDPAEVEPAN